MTIRSGPPLELRLSTTKPATISDSQHGAFEFNPAPVADLAHARAPLPTWRGGLGRAARFLWRACCAARFIATKSSRVIGLSFGGGGRGLGRWQRMYSRW